MSFALFNLRFQVEHWLTQLSEEIEERLEEDKDSVKNIFENKFY